MDVNVTPVHFVLNELLLRLSRGRVERLAHADTTES